MALLRPDERRALLLIAAGYSDAEIGQIRADLTHGYPSAMDQCRWLNYRLWVTRTYRKGSRPGEPAPYHRL